MDIVKALKKEAAKLEKTVRNATNRLATLRATMKLFGDGGWSGGGKTVKRRKMSAAGRLAISKATKARWAKFHAAKTAKPRRKISAAGRASIVKAQKARWAKIHAKKAKAA